MTIARPAPSLPLEAGQTHLPGFSRLVPPATELILRVPALFKGALDLRSAPAWCLRAMTRWARQGRR